MSMLRLVMDYSMNLRVKQLRKKLGLNQIDFSNLLSLSSGYIAGVETNYRRVNDRIIKLIVNEFKVNEDWIRNGIGDMFMQKKTNEKAVSIVSLFNDLPSNLQDVVVGTIELLRKANEIDKKQKNRIL